ncbi:MAG: GNAT family N-acetyltransferase [Anaerolineae bacterium]
MLTLTTPRLLIRRFTLDDLPAVHQMLDLDPARNDPGSYGALSLEQRGDWLRWTIQSYHQLAWLHQPPYYDRAIELRATGELIGACGFAPCLAEFGQLPSLANGDTLHGLTWPEVGLYWEIASGQRRQGYAAEAGQALIEYGFQQLKLRRIVAMTRDDNPASIGVMRKLGMTVEANMLAEPPWLQVVGIIESRTT